MRLFPLLTLSFLVVFTSRAQPTYSSDFVHEPELFVDYVRDCADFWSAVEDVVFDGFFVDVARAGNVTNPNKKGIVSQSRDAFGFTRAFMLTGDEAYLDKARSALNFMYNHLWDSEYGGWYRQTTRDGCCPASTNKTAFDQHYALLGITAMFEATGDSADWEMLMDGHDFIEENLWDGDSLYFGYFHECDRDGTNAEDKSFNSTVDAITTHLYSLYLMTGETRYYDRLMQLKANILDHLVASMADQVIGFAEHYNSDWTIDESEDRTIMGHVLKTAWCLARLYRIQADEEGLDAAGLLAREVLDKAYDHVYGGPYKDYIRTTGEMLLYGAIDTSKAWWQMEQAVTAGFTLFEITWDPEYLEMADESIDFFMKYFVDPEYGEIYADRAREGGRVYYGGGYWDENKGSDFKAAYHSIETGYYAYIYSKLLIKQEPVTLYYRYAPSSADRTLTYSPAAVDFRKLSIIDVKLDGQPYADFDSTDRKIFIPADTGGIFAVTYEMEGLGPVVYEMVSSVRPNTLEFDIYPNPAADWISVRTDGSANTRITLTDNSGRTVLSRKTDGAAVRLNVSELAAGAYLLRVETDSETGARMIVIQ